MPVLTGTPRTLLRVKTPQGTDLNDIPSMLHGVRDEAGANAVLIDDLYASAAVRTVLRGSTRRSPEPE